jgi:hypothetical protein
MKPLIIAVSLLANAALAFAVAQRPAVHAYFSHSSHPTAAVTTATSTQSPATATDAGSEKWSTLATEDLPTVVARLRAGGIPPRYLRAIMETLVAEHFADRHKAIADAIAAKPWWQGPPSETSASDPKILAMIHQLTRDERALLYQTIGPETPASAYDRAWAERKYGSLGPEKREQVSRLNHDYTDFVAEVRAQAGNLLLPEDREKLSYIERERIADLAKTLSPDELFEFNLRSSPGANQLRNQLVAFDPTEEEFRAILKIQQPVEARFDNGRLQNLTPDERRQRLDALTALGDQIQAVLSPERYADYQLKTDPVYIQTNQFVASLQLPPATTAQIVAVQKDAGAQLAAVRTDRSLAPEQLNAQLAAIAEDANTKLTATLGESGLAAYKQRAGSWLRNLEQVSRSRPATPAPKP